MNKHLHALNNIQQKEIEDKIEYEKNETLQLDSESKKIDFEFIADTIPLLLRSCFFQAIHTLKSFNSIQNSCL